MKLAAFCPARRDVLRRFAAATLLAGCSPREEGVGATEAVPGGFASVGELAGWRPDLQLRPAAPVQRATWGIAGPDPLAPLADQLRLLETRRSRQPVLIVQFGDSHTAGPAFIPRLRELMQQRYGAIGPGRLPPGAAPRFYRPALVEVEQQGGWTATSALRAGNAGPFGIAGFKLRGEGAGSRITLRSTESAGFDRFTLDLMVQPGGGSFRLGLDGEASVALHTNQPVRAPAQIPLGPRRRFREATVELLGDGPVELLGWGAERQGPGVIVEGHGINGATIDMLANMDQAILARDLAARPPALIILAYGTNEAVDLGLTEAAYAATLTTRVRALKRLAPRSAILLVGAPDSARHVGRAHGARGRPVQGCAAWSPLPGLHAVKAAQRRVAAEERLAFWDWAEVTNGVCGLDALARSAPPLVAGDHIHFTADGYRLSAERLFARLMRPAAPPAARGA
jgi:lysophospholipase L1-like esterase